MNRPSAELLAEVFPDVRMRSEVSEFGTLLAIDRARQALGYEPRHTWRNHLTASQPGPVSEVSQTSESAPAGGQ